MRIFYSASFKDDPPIRGCIQKKELLVGHLEANDIKIIGKGVSKVHARISISISGLLIEDLNPSAQTYLNGILIEGSAPIEHDDIIQIGQWSLHFSTSSQPKDPKPIKDNQIKDHLVRHVREELNRKELKSVSSPDRDISLTINKRIEQAVERSTSKTSIRNQLKKEIHAEILGLGIVDRFLSDPDVTEIMVNGLKPIYVERNGKIVETGQRFKNLKEITHLIEKIVHPIGRRVDDGSPMVDARLSCGSRVNIVIPPLSIDGPIITIRKFSEKTISIDDLINLGSVTPDAALFLKEAIRARANCIISGGTGSGKTTLLNVMSSFLSKDERIITIEDAAELKLPQPHVVSLESRPPNLEGTGQVTIRDLVRNALRMRPDRIVVGECRGGEALDMLQAMNTGHDGSLTTAHANSPRDLLLRLETMVLMSEMDIPHRAVREQIASAIDFVIHLERFPNGDRKLVMISELTGMEGDVISSQDLFIWGDGSGDGLIKTGLMPRIFEKKFNDHEL